MTRPPARASMWPTARTRLLAVLGWPVTHSLSPVMHNAALREQGLDLVYLALPTPPEELATVVGALGAAEAVGANVTVPHKEAVVPLCDRLTDEAELVGAVNTLSWVGEELVGHNTDAVGLQAALEDVGVGAVAAVMLGTGGAARAAAVALGRLGCTVTVVGRRVDAAADVADLVEVAGGAGRALDLADEVAVRGAIDDAALVMNATSLGLDREPLPAPFMALKTGQIAYDLVYQPADTPFLVAAGEVGASPHHGLGMLIAQAAAAYEGWTGRPAPTMTMSAAALAALHG